MSSIFTNLLFMHGHITNLELARRLAETPADTDKPTGKRKRAATATDAMRKAIAPGPLAQGVCGQIRATALRWATAR